MALEALSITPLMVAHLIMPGSPPVRRAAHAPAGRCPGKGAEISLGGVHIAGLHRAAAFQGQGRIGGADEAARGGGLPQGIMAEDGPAVLEIGRKRFCAVYRGRPSSSGTVSMAAGMPPNG